MKQEGYGVTCGGTPCGLWPVPLSVAQAAAERYRRHKGPGVAVEIVPVYSGAPIGVLPALPSHSEPRHG